MKPAHKLWSGLMALLLTATAQADVSGDFDRQPRQETNLEQALIGDASAIDDSALDEIRGGFTTTSGLQIAFGIERVLYINGNLISTTSLNIADTSKLAPATPVSPVTGANVPTADQVSKATSVPTTTIPAATVPTTTVPVTTLPAQGAGSASNSTVSTANSTALDSAAAGLALIQTGAGNILNSGTVPAASMGTIIQNTLNNQKIQNVTVINATVNSMEILKALNLQSLISSAVNDSVRK